MISKGSRKVVKSWPPTVCTLPAVLTSPRSLWSKENVWYGSERCADLLGAEAAVG